MIIFIIIIIIIIIFIIIIIIIVVFSVIFKKPPTYGEMWLSRWANYKGTSFRSEMIREDSPATPSKDHWAQFANCWVA